MYGLPLMCQVLDVSRSSCHARESRSPAPRA
jgi:hypothetical protein